MMNRPTWQDPRRVRRMAVLLCIQFDGTAFTAKALDEQGEIIAEFEATRWANALAAASHYLRELGRTKT